MHSTNFINPSQKCTKCNLWYAKISDQHTTPEDIAETSLPETSTAEITHETAPQETTTEMVGNTISEETNPDNTIATTVSRQNLTSTNTEHSTNVHLTQPGVTTKDESSDNSNYDTLSHVIYISF